MANSLRSKLSKLRHDGHITDAEYKAFINKLDGHDREIYGSGYNQGTIDRAEEVTKAREHGYNKAIDDVMKKAKELQEEQIKNLEKSPMRNGKRWAGYMITYLGHIQTACKRLIGEQLKGGV